MDGFRRVTSPMMLSNRVHSMGTGEAEGMKKNVELFLSFSHSFCPGRVSGKAVHFR